MTDYMNQDEAMNMTNDQAVQILEPLRDMMRDQHGCPIGDAYFAIDKAIQALILDTLMAYRDIVGSGCCNDCRIAKPYSCEHLLKPGQLVRYNCPFYERKEDTNVNVKS